jgi:sarcosine oxidase subunit beta
MEMWSRAEAVIIGGGINGLGLAYALAKGGMRDVIVLEREYLGSGATGRCAGGIRQQWGTRENVLLARESVRLWEGLSEELGYNVWFRQGGYLLLAFTEEELRELEANVRLQNSLRVKSRLLSPEEAMEKVPLLRPDGIVGAAFCGEDGIAYHQAAVWGYAEAARRLGVEIWPFTEVTHVRVKGGEVQGVETTRGEVQAPVVVNAAGGHSRRIAEMVGVELPNRPYRREILATEPLKPVLDPLVLSFHHNTYFAQTMRGEIIAGTGGEEERPSEVHTHSLRFLQRTAKTLLRLAPQLGALKTLRQWSGLYDVTPDGKPILGEADEVEGFYQLNGFSGHGFMFAPIATQLMAELILHGETSLPIDSLHPRRFEEGETEKERFIVG